MLSSLKDRYKMGRDKKRVVLKVSLIKQISHILEEEGARQTRKDGKGS